MGVEEVVEDGGVGGGVGGGWGGRGGEGGGEFEDGGGEGVDWEPGAVLKGKGGMSAVGAGVGGCVYWKCVGEGTYFLQGG